MTGFWFKVTLLNVWLTWSDAHVQGGKFDLMKILCMHAIKAAFSVEKQAHTLTDDMYTTASWRSVYEETINPTTVPEDS